MERSTTLRLTGLSRLVGQVAVIAAIILIWHLSASGSTSVKFFLGSPRGVLESMLSDLLHGPLAGDTLITLREAGTGLAAGWLIGFVIAVLLSELPRLHEVLSPMLTAVTAVPIVAVSPLLIIAFGTGIPLATSVAATSVSLMTVAQVHAGMTDSRLRWWQIAESHNAEKRRFFFHVVLPGAAVWLISGARAAISFALLGAFIGEFISAELGLGRYILRFAALYDANRVLAGIILISVVALAFDYLVSVLTSRFGVRASLAPFTMFKR